MLTWRGKTNCVSEEGLTVAKEKRNGDADLSLVLAVRHTDGKAPRGVRGERRAAETIKRGDLKPRNLHGYRQVGVCSRTTLQVLTVKTAGQVGGQEQINAYEGKTLGKKTGKKTHQSRRGRTEEKI